MQVSTPYTLPPTPSLHSPPLFLSSPPLPSPLPTTTHSGLTYICPVLWRGLLVLVQKKALRVEEELRISEGGPLGGHIDGSSNAVCVCVRVCVCVCVQLDSQEQVEESLH